MVKCDNCGRDSLFSKKIGSINLCKICCVLSNESKWNDVFYESSDEYNKTKKKLINSLTFKNFSKKAIDGINDYFESRYGPNYICGVDSGRQTIKLFNDRVELYTDKSFSNDAYEEEIINCYKSRELKKEFFGDGKSFVKNILTDGVAGTVKKVVLGTVLSEFDDNDDYKENIVLVSGVKTIKLEDIKEYAIFEPNESGHGRFKIALKSGRLTAFYFTYPNLKRVNTFASTMYEKAKRKWEEEKKKEKESEQKATTFNVEKERIDTLREYKKLLDEGIINEDEYNKKKKQILGE